MDGSQLGYLFMPNTLNASVIIITHNRSELLGNAVSSVEVQTVQAFEVIVVDDCSDEIEARKNREICQGRARYVYLKERRGPQYARNYGARMAGSDILCFLDDDDEFVDIKLERILNAFEKNESVGAISNSFWVRRRNKLLKVIHTETKMNVDELLSINPLGGCSMMSIRRTLFDSLGGFSEDLKSSQDWDLWIKIYLASTILCIREPLTIYNVIEGARISSNTKKSFLGRRKFYFKYRKFMSRETRLWNLFILASFGCGLHVNFSSLLKSLSLLIRTRHFIEGGIVLASILKRATIK
jgi:glycosyltransferase involved in cell wall biosynthesis